MSIARAFTTRRVKQSLELKDANDIMHRSNTTSKAASYSIRNKISGPVELISTTNMLSYNAPDIYPKTASSNSSKSDDDSDTLTSTSSTPPTSPDSPHPHQHKPSSPPVTKQRDTSPEPNHLSCYFTAPGQAVPGVAAASTPEAPVIPQRAPSHIKKSYETLTRNRSNSRMSEQSTRTVSTKASFSFSRSSSTSTSTSATSHSHASTNYSAIKGAPAPPPTTSLPAPPVPAAAKISAPAPAPAPAPVHAHAPQHHHHAAPVPAPSPAPASAALRRDQHQHQSHNPFGHELAQVSELAEEFQPRLATLIDEEEKELQRKGLVKVSAEDYLREIPGLFESFIGEMLPVTLPVLAKWI